MGKGSDRKGVCDEEQEICLPSSTIAVGEEDLVNEEESRKSCDARLRSRPTITRGGLARRLTQHAGPDELAAGAASLAARECNPAFFI